MLDRTVPLEFDAVARALRRLAISFSNVTDKPRSAGSQADDDAHNTTLDGPWGAVGREVAHRYAPITFLAVDHLFALAQLVRTERVVAAHLTVARAALEALALVYWFYDPDITFDERVRRHVNLRLRRATETSNLVGRTGPDSEKIVKEINESAHLLGLVVTPPKRAWESPRLGQAIPRSMTLTETLVGASSTSEIGAVPYRLYSASAHGGDHTLAHWVLEAVDTAEPGIAHATLGITPHQLVASLAPVPLAADAALSRLAAYQGWDLTPWRITYQQTLLTLRPYLQRQVDASS